MLEILRLQRQLSDMRQRLANPDLADDARTDLLAKYSALEQRHATLLEAEIERRESEAVTTDTNLDSLMARASVGEFFAGAMSGRGQDGANAELQQELGLGRNQLPVDLLETRAVTPAPADVGVNQQEIAPYVFPRSAGAFLQVPQPMVGAGDALYPDVASSATVGGPHTDSTAVAETTGGFNTVAIKPARLQASYFYRRTDAARFASMDEALRQTLTMSLSDAFDKYIITQILANTSITALTDPSAAIDRPTSLANMAYGRVDGRIATSVADTRSVINTEDYSYLSSLYQTSAVTDSALNQLMRDTGGVRVSAHVGAAASNVTKQIIRLGSRRDAVAPIWRGVSLIVDEVTKASTGEIVITAVLLANFAMLRTQGFYINKNYIA